MLFNYICKFSKKKKYRSFHRIIFQSHTFLFVLYFLILFFDYFWTIILMMTNYNCEYPRKEEHIPTYQEELQKNFNNVHKSKENCDLLSPIDLNYKQANIVLLPELKWINYEFSPSQLQVTNTGKSVILSAKWILNEYPFLTGGPLNSNYVLSKIYFLWSTNTNAGSVHTIDGQRQALEVHVVHFREEYGCQEKAIRKRDGIVIVVYLFEIRFRMNNFLEPIILTLNKLKTPNSSTYIDSFIISKMLPTFGQNYYTYFGTKTSYDNSCLHCVQWIISRELLSVSFYQMKQFNPLFGKNLLPIKRIWRRIVDEERKPILFLANPKYDEIRSTWDPAPRNIEMVGK